MASGYEVKLNLKLDTSDAKRQLDDIKKQLGAIGATQAKTQADASDAVERAAWNINMNAVNRGLKAFGSQIDEVAKNLGVNGVGSAINELNKGIQSGIQAFQAFGSAGAAAATALASFNIGLQLGTSLFGSQGSLQQLIDEAGRVLQNKNLSDEEIASGYAAAKSRLTSASIAASKATQGGRFSVKDAEENLRTALQDMAYWEGLLSGVKPKSNTKSTTKSNTSGLDPNAEDYWLDLIAARHETEEIYAGRNYNFSEGVNPNEFTTVFGDAAAIATVVEEAIEEAIEQIPNSFNDVLQSNTLDALTSIGGSVTGENPLARQQKIQEEMLQIIRRMSETQATMKTAMVG